MPLLAILDEAAFNALPDVTVLGKDSYLKDERTNTFGLALDGAEAGKLAVPLQNELKKLKDNNAKLLDEKVKVIERAEAFEKLGKTAEEFETILKEGVTADTEKLTGEFNKKFESLKAENLRLLEAAKIEAETAKTEKAETERHLRSTIKQAEITRLTAEFGVTKGGEDFFANRIDVVYDEGLKKYVPRVVENGEVAYKGTAFKTPTQLAEETKANKDYANIFAAGIGAGGGVDPRQRAGGVGGAFTVSRSASKENPSLYQRAKEEAAKTGGEVIWTE